MKTRLYQEDTIASFEFLKCQTPQHIFTDGHCQVVFNYGNCHIIAFPEGFIAASQNRSDEMIRAKFDYNDSTFQPHEYDKLLFQGKTIDRLWILRTVLYFTDYVVFNSEEEALGDFEIETGTDRVIGDMMRKSTGSYDEVVCHPKSIEAEGLNKEFANLVDAGIVLEIDHKLLLCFSWDNSFSLVGEIMSPEEIKEEIAPFYEFIEV